MRPKACSTRYDLHLPELPFQQSVRVSDVNPYKLINNNGIWYLLADEGNTLKTFTFSKIENFKVKSSAYTPNTDFLNDIANNESKWFSEDVIDVMLEIDSPLIEYFTRRDILPNQTIIEQTDEKLILSTKVSYEEEILGIVKHGLPFIENLQPENFWTDEKWFKRHSVRLAGTSSIYKVRTKMVKNKRKDIVIKWNRMGQDIPGAEDCEELMDAEFNSPFEEFSLVMELRDAIDKSPSKIIVHKPLAIYVPAKYTELWQSGRKFLWAGFNTLHMPRRNHLIWDKLGQII